MPTGNRGTVENLIPWKPGQSGNPSGRPKGIARQARDLINNDPSRLLNVFLEAAEDPKAKLSDRLIAAREYLDRAYGKAPAYAPMEGDGDPLELIDRRISKLVDELAARRQGEALVSTDAGAMEAASQA